MRSKRPSSRLSAQTRAFDIALDEGHLVARSGTRIDINADIAVVASFLDDGHPVWALLGPDDEEIGVFISKRNALECAFHIVGDGVGG
jgi:hypothetical protein